MAPERHEKPHQPGPDGEGDVPEACDCGVPGYAVCIEELPVAEERFDAAPLVSGGHAGIELAPWLRISRSVVPLLSKDGSDPQDASARSQTFVGSCGFDRCDPFAEV